MSMTKDALVHIEQQAIAATATPREMADFPIALVPAGMEVKSLEEHMEFRNQFRGALTTESIKDFTAYCNSHGGGACFINRKDMQAKAIFDIGSRETPGHCRHTALIQLKRTAAYEVVMAVAGRRISQQDLAEFVEDWRDNITMYGNDTSDEISIAKGIAAIRKVTISRKSHDEHGVQHFGASRSALDEIEAKSGDDKLPGYIDFRCTPYHGLSEYQIALRVSLPIPVAGEAGVSFILRVVKEDELHEQMGDDFHRLVTSDLDGNITPYMGSFKSSV